MRVEERGRRRAGVRRRVVALVANAALIAAASLCAHAAPISRADLTALCIEAEDAAQCGRLVEARKLRALSRIAERDGNELRVSLSPFGLTIFRDSANVRGTRSYAIWDYVEDLDTLVLFTTNGDRSGFMLVQRHGGGEYGIPAEPVFSPDRARFVTVDVCPRDCDDEIAVWRVGPESVAKEAVWRPPADWTDASATWRGDGRIAIEYQSAGDSASHTVERRLADPSWQRPRAK